MSWQREFAGLASWLFSSGLGLLVTWLSDPDNLNQLVVSQLDSVNPKGSVQELCGSDLDLGSLASQEGEGEGSEVWVAVIFCTLLAWPRHAEHQSNDCKGHLLCLKLELNWFCLVSVFFFVFFSGALREQGFHPAPGSRPKGKVCFVIFVIKRLI